MPQIALILCHFLIHFLESTLTDKFLLWVNSMLIESMQFYNEFIELFTVCSQVMYFFYNFLYFYIYIKIERNKKISKEKKSKNKREKKEKKIEIGK